MSDNALPDEAAPDREEPKVRHRMKPGQRREQILQTLAGMLEQPGTERITTALLASKLDVSEAALYRHFASKAQMFEGLLDFIDQTVFGLVNQIIEREGDGAQKAARIIAMLLQFGERNQGMTRVMVGDALVHENERLQQRMNQFFDRLESSLRQVLKDAQVVRLSQTPTVEAQVRASVLTAFALGRLQRFARSGFKKSPTEQLEAALALVMA